MFVVETARERFVAFNDSFSGSHAEKPWLRASNETTSVGVDTERRENERAKEAYRALKTISLRRSDLDEYKNFETRVKERAEKKYNYSRETGKEYEASYEDGEQFRLQAAKLI